MLTANKGYIFALRHGGSVYYPCDDNVADAAIQIGASPSSGLLSPRLSTSLCGSVSEPMSAPRQEWDGPDTTAQDAVSEAVLDISLEPRLY